MSFVPVPQHASQQAGDGKGPPGRFGGPASSATAALTALSLTTASATTDSNAAELDENLIFKLRTFDLMWMDRKALMYKDGIAKTYDRELRKALITVKQRSSIPLILRDMAPPEGSIFDPAKRWDEEKNRRRASKSDVNEGPAGATEKGNKKGGGGKKGAEKKKSTADTIKEANALEKLKKDHERDLQKLSNLKKLKELQETNCETTSGKIHRMMKMLHLAVCDLRQGAVGSSEAEVLDIFWALEEMPAFRSADEEVSNEKAAKKEEKEKEKADKKKFWKDVQKDDEKEKDKKVSKKDKEKEKESKKVVLSTEAQSLKALYRDGADSRGSYKDSLKYARKLMSSKENIISFQLLEMPDRLPPLSRYNRQFKLEDWQCDVLEAIDEQRSAVVCAPTSSGKTLLSTYTCKNEKDTVLFVLPSEVLIWQVAATYYQFFKGNVTVCTDQITFQEVTGKAQVYIGTPLALERSISKVRGIAGDEMMGKGEREFIVLDGGYHQFKYLVLDEVHTLNGPEGDALQRIIKACNCPILALSATIGNAKQLRDWFNSVVQQHVEAVAIDGKPNDGKEVLLKEHYARFINLQRYVVTETEGKDGKKKQKLVKLHPVAAMTPERLKNEPDLISSLAMTPSDLMDLWERMQTIFPSTVLEDLDDPDKFFDQFVDSSKRVTLNMTREYETRLKKRLTNLSQSHPELYERLRQAQLPPPLTSMQDVSDILYGVVDQLKQSDLLPAVAFQLNTYGAFSMFKTLLKQLESEQVAQFPNYRRELIKIAREKAQMRKVAAGKASRENAAEAEEEAKSGFVDESLMQEDTTKPHDKFVLTATGKRLSYNEVEDIIADMKKAGEVVDINHALIRGLRRGIAIYTKEVGFSCYRRQVQTLAQKGRLAVVFSDDALAYGVNMPFRSCVFCGDMGDDLTPLIAQQMQGRAGRRGLDVQGSVIYLGMEWPYIENLMLGQISEVTGKEPRYPIMVLQQALAASNDPDDTNHFVHDDTPLFGPAIRKYQKHLTQVIQGQIIYMPFPTVTEQQMEWMCGTTLEEFCRGEKSDHYLGLSTDVIRALGYVNNDLTLAIDHNALTMVWEMHDHMPEAVHLCAVLELMYQRFCLNKTKDYQATDAAQNEFLPVLLHIVDRAPAIDGEESLQDLLRIVSTDGRAINDDARSVWLETERILIEFKARIDTLPIPEVEKQKLHLIPPPADSDEDVGPPLDKCVYEMLVSKQKGFAEDLSFDRRNELKNRIVRLGQICLTAHNNVMQPHGKLEALEILFRKLFQNIKYSVGDMMRQLTDQEDLTEI